MITRGGGFLGSELCRQIMEYASEAHIFFDVYENSVYEIWLELKEKYPNLHLKTLIASLFDSRRVFQISEKYHLKIVYHAAAHYQEGRHANSHTS